MGGRYLGVVGVTTRAMAQSAHATYEQCVRDRGERTVRLMLGVCVDNRTLDGLPSTHPETVPDRDRVPELMYGDLRVLNLVHYSTSRPRTGLAQQLTRALELGGSACDGLLLNVDWPSEMALGTFRTHAPDAELILRIPSVDVARGIEKPGWLCEALARYSGLVDHVLLCAPNPDGAPSTMHRLALLLMQLEAAELSLGLGIAGGFCAENLDMLLAPVLDRYWRVSITAQRGLQGKTGALEHDAVARYIFAAYGMLS